MYNNLMDGERVPAVTFLLLIIINQQISSLGYIHLTGTRQSSGRYL